MRLQFRHLAVVAAVMTVASVALAQESEFQGKIQEDLNGYKGQVVSACGTAQSLALRYNGKLGSNPRETQKGNYSAVSTLCTSGVAAIVDGCTNNAVVKGKLKGLTNVVCQPGHGTIGYGISGGTLTLSVDPAFTGNNPSGQQDDLVTKLKKDMDK